MKAFSTLTLLLLSSIVSADFFGSSQKSIVEDSNDLSVPGDNPLNYCEDPSEGKHILKITNVDLEPNPPEA